MFKKIDDAEAVIVERGVFRPAEAYTRDGAVFVKAKGGFVRVKQDMSTSHPDVKLDAFHYDGPLFLGQFGRIYAEPGAGRKKLDLIGGTADNPTLLKPPEK